MHIFGRLRYRERENEMEFIQKNKVKILIAIVVVSTLLTSVTSASSLLAAWSLTNF